MKDLLTLLQEADRLTSAGEACALATVVRVNGSAYRRPGARMLIAADGQTTGTISGGCLEGEVAQRALRILENGEPPEVHPFQLTDDDFVGFGVGCDGIVHVLIEPVPQIGQHSPISLLQTALASRAPSVLATIIEASESAQPTLSRRYLLLDNGTVHQDALPEHLQTAVAETVHVARAQGHPYLHTLHTPNGDVSILAEVIRPPIRLLIFGEGHDVAPVVQFGKALGWTVIVAGRKSQEVLRFRFPDADAWVFLMHPEEALAYVDVDAYTAAVSMCHNYNRDRSILHALLSSAAPYLGILGPKRRTKRMLADLASQSVYPTPQEQARLRGPVGLDIGTETSEEIALAIVAEVQAVMQGRQGGALSEREGPIHEAISIR